MSWTGKDHVDFHDEDMVMSDLDVEPLRRALGCMEHVFQTLLTGFRIENLSVLLTAQGTRGTAVPRRCPSIPGRRSSPGPT